MSKEGKADRKGVGFFRSVSFRIIMVAFCSVVIAVVFCLLFIIPRAQSIVSDITQNYMLSMATAERARLDAVIGDTAGTTEQFASILENVKEKVLILPMRILLVLMVRCYIILRQTK